MPNPDPGPTDRVPEPAGSGTGASSVPPAGDAPVSIVRRVLASGMCSPVVLVAFSIFALIHLLRDEQALVVTGGQGLGPTGWPILMLLGVIVSSVILFGCKAHDCLRGVNAPPRATVDRQKVILATVAVVAYGLGIELIGFALSTFLFLGFWLVLTGRFDFSKILVISLSGTVAMLYLFIKIAYTPLPRGVDFFDDVSIFVYQVLGIF